MPPLQKGNTNLEYAGLAAVTLGDVDAALGELAAVVNSLLRDRMLAQGLSQSRVAAGAGISQPQLSRLLSGSRDWELDVLSSVCQVLGTRASDIIAVAEDMRGSR